MVIFPSLQRHFLNRRPSFTMTLRQCLRITGLMVACLCATPPVSAQSSTASFQLNAVEFGFRTYADQDKGAFKTGLWTPVYVTFDQTEEGPIRLPLGLDKMTRNVLSLGVKDSVGMQSNYYVNLELGRTKTKTVLTYANPSRSDPYPRLQILPNPQQTGGRTFSVPPKFPNDIEPLALPYDGHLYLTVGTKLQSFHKAVSAMSGVLSKGRKARVAAYENDPSRLPDQWFGYQSVDLLILTTGIEGFVKKLFSPTTQQDEQRLTAMIEWVRRGGRLVVSVSKDNQDRVQKFLQSKRWQPPLPDVLSPNKTVLLPRIEVLHQWAKAHETPFPFKQNNKVARLLPNKSVEILIQDTEAGNIPLMVRVPYGRGSVTLLAVEVDGTDFRVWEGNTKFWQRLVSDLGPRVRAFEQQDNLMINNQGFMPESNDQQDIATQLYRELEEFNVTMISFGWVALFIFLYILVVGPLDYLILKKVFKRLEWTWITFPTVVILISVIAYFTAYALKGSQLKVNKVDLVDIDLRTSLDEKFKPKKAYAYGTTWFSILSPRIESYTVGIQPQLGVWSGDPSANPQVHETMVTSLGRPFGRSRSAGLFRRTYDYAPAATGLLQVPIPVWTTRAFSASWESKFDQLPLIVDLSYNPNDPDQKITGFLQNNMTVDLEDIILVYGERYFDLRRTLQGKGSGGDANRIDLNLAGLRASDIGRWVREHGGPSAFGNDGNTFYATSILRGLYFFDKTQVAGDSERNHLLRGIDQSWRLKVFPPQDDSVRTAILIARLSRAEGLIKELTASNDPRLPTQLWTGELPTKGKSPPPLEGTMIQDTYIRIFIPIRPTK